MNSSGVNRSTVAEYFAHSCGFQGLADHDYDPEIDRCNAVVKCPGCGEVVEEHVQAGMGWWW